MAWSWASSSDAPAVAFVAQQGLAATGVAAAADPLAISVSHSASPELTTLTTLSSTKPSSVSPSSPVSSLSRTSSWDGRGGRAVQKVM